MAEMKRGRLVPIPAGTYTFTFSGANVTNATPLAASGSVTLNGNGKVTGGIINCNQDG